MDSVQASQQTDAESSPAVESPACVWEGLRLAAPRRGVSGRLQVASGTAVIRKFAAMREPLGPHDSVEKQYE